jgi:hypothetical protein
VDVVPVDYVSGAIMQLAQQNDATGQTFHLNNPEPLLYGDLLYMMRSLGIEVQVVSFAEWRRRLVALAVQAAGNGAASFLPLLEEVTAEQVFMPAFDCRNTLRGLGASGVSCPPVDARLLQTYFAYFRRKGLLPDFGAREVQGAFQANGDRHGRRQGDRRRL